MVIRLAFLLLLAFGCFYGLGNYGLLDNNEGLYASIARTMLHGGDIIIPHLNGLPYLEKPPLLYWLTAASMALFGEDAFAARLPFALATFLLAVAMNTFLSRQAHPRAGLISGLMIASCPVILIIGRTVYCDMLLTVSLSIALMAFYRWYCEGRLRWLLLCHGMIALAVLSKGLVAVFLAGGAACCFLIAENAWKRMAQAFDPRAIAVFLLVAAPWHIAASWQESNFAWFYFVNEHVMRFFAMREPHDYHRGPIWYYLPRLLGYLFPWAVFLPLLVRQKPAQGEERTLQHFLWSWFLFTLFFFSMARAKSNYYMIAGLPPLVMLLALRLESYLKEQEAKNLWLFVSAALLATGALIAAIPTACRFGLGEGAFLCTDFNPQTATWVMLTMVVSILCCWQWRAHPQRYLWLLCLPGALMLLVLVNAATLSEQSLSQKDAALYVVQHGMASDTALYQDFEGISALSFYVGQPLPIVDSISDDLAYGMHHGNRPDLFPTLAQWLEHAQGHEAHLVVRNHAMTELKIRLAQSPHTPALCVEKAFDAVSILGHCEPGDHP